MEPYAAGALLLEREVRDLFDLTDLSASSNRCDA